MSVHSTTVKIPSFDGKQLGYLQYRQNILKFAKQLGKREGDTNGLIGAILSPAEFQLLLESQQSAPLGRRTRSQDLTGEFIFLENPGKRPICPKDASTKNELDNWTTHVLKPWEFAREQFTDQSDSLIQLQDAVEQSLDSNSRGYLEHIHHGLMNLTSAQILEYLDERFATPSERDMEINREKLSMVFRKEDDFDTLLITHQNAHQYATLAKHPISEADKISYLKRSITPCGIFDRKMELYRNEYPELSQRSFGTMSCSMLSEWREYSQTLPAKNPAASANAATSDDSIALRAEVKALRDTIANFNSVPGKEDKKKPKKFNSEEYCWSHGNCNHSSAACKNPADGHKSAATKSDNMGGSAKTWSSRFSKAK